MLKPLHHRLRVLACLMALIFIALPQQTHAADGWNRLNPFNAIPAPKWPEWATVKMPEVDLLPDWVKLPDVREIPGEFARLHRRNMNALGNAVNYINPFKRQSVTRPVPPPTGSRTTSSVSKPSANKFWFPSFMENERRLGPSRSVSEFLDQPRIR